MNTRYDDNTTSKPVLKKSKTVDESLDKLSEEFGGSSFRYLLSHYTLIY